MPTLTTSHLKTLLPSTLPLTKSTTTRKLLLCLCPLHVLLCVGGGGVICVYEASSVPGGGWGGGGGGGNGGRVGGRGGKGQSMLEGGGAVGCVGVFERRGGVCVCGKGCFLWEGDFCVGKGGGL